MNSSKYKIKFDLISDQTYSSISGYLCLSNTHIILKIDDKNYIQNKIKKQDIIKVLFAPIFHDGENIFINFALIHKFINFGNNKFKLELFNPNKTDYIILEIFNIMEPGLFIDMKLNKVKIKEIEFVIENKKQQKCKEMKENIEQFLDSLKNGIRQEGILLGLEDMFYESMVDCKKYYEKAVDNLTKSDKIKQKIKKKIKNKEKLIMMNNNNSFITQNLNLDNILNISNNNTLSNMADSIIDDFEERNYSNYDSIFLKLFENCVETIETTVQLFFKILGKIDKTNVTRNLKIVNKIDQIINKEKKQSKLDKENVNSSKKFKEYNCYQKNDNQRNSNNSMSDNLSRTDMRNVFNNSFTNNNFIINMNIDNNLSKICNRNIKINNCDKTIRIKISLNNTIESQTNFSDPDHINNLNFSSYSNKIKKNMETHEEETPKFFFNPEVITPIIKSVGKNKENLVVELNNKIEEFKKNHMFLPPNNFSNIIHNSSEITIRIFFQKCFDKYIGKLFISGIDELGIIKIDSIITYFLYIKGFRTFLNNQSNKIINGNNIFLQEN